jgi:hypothetical protein
MHYPGHPSFNSGKPSRRLLFTSLQRPDGLARSAENAPGHLPMIVTLSTPPADFRVRPPLHAVDARIPSLARLDLRLRHVIRVTGIGAAECVGDHPESNRRRYATLSACVS